MAVYLDIVKVKENSNSVIYTYETTDNRIGKFEISKSDQSVKTIQQMVNDTGGLLSRAVYKVKKGVIDGIYPDRCEWAS